MVGYVVDDPAPDVDVRVELTGGDAGEVEGGRPEVEVAAAHAAAVDELLEHDGHRQLGRPRRPAVQNSASRSVFRRRRERDRRAVGASRRARRRRAAPRSASPVLSSCTTPNDTSPSRASSSGGTTPIDTSTTRGRPPRAGCRRSGRPRRSTAGVPKVDEAAVLGVEADVADGGEHRCSTTCSAISSMASVASPPGARPTRARAAAVPSSG